MPDIFSARPGYVSVTGPNISLPLTVTMTGWLDAAVMKAIITQAGVRESGRYQFLYTLRDFIYVYIFGDMLGEINIGGLAFSCYCNENFVKTGFEQVLAYYSTYRLRKTGAPVTLTIGTTSFAAFLVDFRVAAEDPALGLINFSMRFMFPHKDTNIATSGSPPVMITSNTLCCQPTSPGNTP